VDGTVWIAEDVDPEDTMMLTGRFSGYFDRFGRSYESFEDLSIDDAIAWGRARCAVVLIRTGDSDYFSAGEHNPDPEEFPLWPPAGVRVEPWRPGGFEALDNTEDDEPVLWDVRIKAELAEGDARRFHDTVRTQVRTHPAVQDVRTPAPGYPAASAAFLLEASTEKQARETAQAILDEAVVVLLETVPTSPRERLFFSGVEVYPHRPGVSVTGPGITY
jgi:hypothetical protein